MKNIVFFITIITKFYSCQDVCCVDIKRRQALVNVVIVVLCKAFLCLFLFTLHLSLPISIWKFYTSFFHCEIFATESSIIKSILIRPWAEFRSKTSMWSAFLQTRTLINERSIFVFLNKNVSNWNSEIGISWLFFQRYIRLIENGYCRL